MTAASTPRRACGCPINERHSACLYGLAVEVGQALAEEANADAARYRAALARIAGQTGEPWAAAVARQALAEEAR